MCFTSIWHEATLINWAGILSGISLHHCLHDTSRPHVWHWEVYGRLRNSVCMTCVTPEACMLRNVHRQRDCHDPLPWRAAPLSTAIPQVGLPWLTVKYTLWKGLHRPVTTQLEGKDGGGCLISSSSNWREKAISGERWCWTAEWSEMLKWYAVRFGIDWIGLEIWMVRINMYDLALEFGGFYSFQEHGGNSGKGSSFMRCPEWAEQEGVK